MKKVLFYLTVLLSVVAAPMANAKGEKKEKGADDVVEVTMVDGSVEKGKITKYWTALLKKGFNKTFAMKTDDGRELKLTSDDVRELYFPLRDTVEKAIRYESTWVAVPKLGNKDKLEKWILAKGKASEHASHLWYMGWATVMYGSQTRREFVATHCVKFDNDSVAYPFYYEHNGGFITSVMYHHLKKSNPDLMEYIKRYFKKNKEAKKRMNKDVGVMLEVYEEYLKQ